MRKLYLPINSDMTNYILFHVHLIIGCPKEALKYNLGYNPTFELFKKLKLACSWNHGGVFRIYG